MGRPRKYLTDAERQAAHRARTKAEWVEVPRASHDALTERLDKLQSAIYHAAKRGDETAQACSAANIDTMLDKLTIWFAHQNEEAAAHLGGAAASSTNSG